MSILTYIAGWPLLAALALVVVPRNYRVIIRAIAVLTVWIDRWISEGAIIGAIRGGTELRGRELHLAQTGNLQTHAFLFVPGVALLLYFVLGK